MARKLEVDKISPSLLEASDHLDLRASENVSDSGQSRGRMSLLDPDVDRKTGILPCDTDATINALGINLIFARTGWYASSRKTLREFAVSFLKCLSQLAWQQKY